MVAGLMNGQCFDTNAIHASTDSATSSNGHP